MNLPKPFDDDDPEEVLWDWIYPYGNPDEMDPEDMEDLEADGYQVRLWPPNPIVRLDDSREDEEG